MKRRSLLAAATAATSVSTLLAAPAAITPRTYETDVLVIGAGAAGLAAAIEACRAGRRVVLIEKMGTLGGNSLISNGGMSVPRTPLQLLAGIEDSPELLAADIMRAGYVSSPERVQRLTESALDAWLWTQRELGVRWNPTLLVRDNDHSVPRTLFVVNRTGSGLIFPMATRARSMGVEIVLNRRFEHFLVDDAGRILGAEVTGPSSERLQIRALRGTVLATGGFGADPEFRKMQNWRLSEQVGTTNQPGATSESLREACRIGAWPLHVQYIHCIPETSPDEQGWGEVWRFTRYCAATQGMWVTAERGRRFVNECASIEVLTNAILDRFMEKESVLALADRQAVEQPSSPIIETEDVEELVNRGLILRYETLEALSADLGVPYAALEDEVKAYNRERAKGRSFDALGRPITLASLPMGRGPWYASRVLPKVYQCTGGVATDAETRVLSVVDGTPIQGLYAAGEITGGIHGITHLGSMGLTDALVNGRIAGRNAAL